MDNTDTIYKINYYLQDLDLTNYTLDSTDTINAVTDSIITPKVKDFSGFTSPEEQELTVKNDGTSYIDYYYTRNTYDITVNGGTSDKYTYYFEEQGSLEYDRKLLDATYVFKYWASDCDVNISNMFSKNTTFIMPANNVVFSVGTDLNRLNTNIYKNIFPEEVFNMEYINNAMMNTAVSTEDIKQENHNLSVYDVVYCDGEGNYHKALAEDSERAYPVGIVSEIKSTNVFTMLKVGKTSYQHMDFEDTTILYLSDKTPGKLVHYSEIENKIYVPVAVYVDNYIIINIIQGSIGDEMLPYGEVQQNFETYSEQDLDDVISQITSGVKS